MRVRKYLHKLSALFLLALGQNSPCRASTTSAMNAFSTPNNLLPNLDPPSGAWRGAELGAVNSSAAAYHAKYGQPLQLWRTFSSNFSGNPEIPAWVRRGGILWFNMKPGFDNGSWEKAVNGTYDAYIDECATSVASLAPALVFVCVYHEPDHHVNEQGNKPTFYRGMWERVQTMFAQRNVTNTVWVMDYSTQIGYKTGGNVAPLWPGDDRVDWLFFNVFEKKSERRTNQTYSEMVGNIYSDLLRNSSETCPYRNATCNFASKPWGLGAFGTHNDIVEEDRVVFLDDALAGITNQTFPKLKAYLYFDAKESAVSPAMQPAYEAFIAAKAFAENDAGAPPS